MPPTLGASIYGMNFRAMPELDWTFGYPLAIGLMLLSGISPYWYFMRRGWRGCAAASCRRRTTVAARLRTRSLPRRWKD